MDKTSSKTQKATKNSAQRRKRSTAAKIDSINIASPTILTSFIQHNDYLIDKIQIKDKADQYKWINAFGRSYYNKISTGLINPWSELYIIHSNRGEKVPVKLHNRSKSNYILELAGIHHLGGKDSDLLQILKDIGMEQSSASITRTDIAIDYLSRVPHKVIACLKEKCKKYTKKENTHYYEIGTVVFVIYNKSIKEKLPTEMGKIIRLEIRFSASFFKITKKGEKRTLRLFDLSLAIEKMEKYIKRKINLNIMIDQSLCKLISNNTSGTLESNTENKGEDDKTTKCNGQNTLHERSLIEKKDNILLQISKNILLILTYAFGMRKEIKKVKISLKSIMDKLDTYTQTQTKILTRLSKMDTDRKDYPYKKYITVQDFTSQYIYSSGQQKNLRGRVKNPLPFHQDTDYGKILYKVEDVDKWIDGLKKR